MTRKKSDVPRALKPWIVLGYRGGAIFGAGREPGAVRRYWGGRISDDGVPIGEGRASWSFVIACSEALGMLREGF